MTISKHPSCNRKKNKLKPHKEATSILFEHSYDIKNFFNDIKGIYEIDHFSMSVINSDNIVVFSSKPSIECNLLKNNLLEKDSIYNVDNYHNNNVFWWNYSHDNINEDRIEYFKLLKSEYTFGFTIKKQIGNNLFLCSFCTKLKLPRHEIQNYYQENLNNLIKLSELCIKKTAPIFSPYNKITTTQNKTPFDKGLKTAKKKSFLTLIVNNT